MAVDPIPKGYPRVIPYLNMDGAAAALDFYAEIFGAKERYRIDGPDGRIGHAEIEIGDSVIMLADEFPEMDVRGPKAIGGTPVTLTVYVENVDDVFGRALKAGAKELRPLKDQFYGDRSGVFEDPFGHRWTVSSHIEDISAEDMEQRAAEAAQT